MGLTQQYSETLKKTQRTLNDAELLNVLDYVAGEARFLECFITSSYCKDERVNVDFLTSSLLKMAKVDAID